MTNKGMSPPQIVEKLGLSRKSISPKMVSLGLIIFFALFALEIMVNLVSSITGTAINTNVDLLLGSAPLWFFIFTAIIAPINEEIFFRGFLVPRIGILVSAVIFGLLHASYNSTFGVEIIAAVIFGLIAGYVFKKSNSLYPSIIAHILLNTLAVLAFAVI
ncbi:MAG TPA: CPBP family intramembrane glutamic endopeptidase [Candidatus Aquilonibacter sp.]|nr:CPBP family intramembrane glutamic endopeptidase [Candidatus Aquilonibacter sp.]